jgi:exonuclease VII small subunit
MKSKNIPADIKIKTIKEAQNEIKEIVEKLEKAEINLKDSKEEYDRMMHLNYHIQEKFKNKVKEIKYSKLEKNE